MPLLEAVRMALGAIRAQKLKSFFSLIGVLIGVTFLVAVVSVIQGMNVYMEDRFANVLVGHNTFKLRQRPDFVGGDVSDDVWRAWLRRPRISYADADFVTARITRPVLVSKFCQDRMPIAYGSKVAKDIELTGVEDTYFRIRDIELASGRAFTPQEVRTARPVLVLGSLVAEKLFGGREAVGKEVRVAGLPYRVIGVAKSRGTLFGLSLDKFALMPYTAPGRRYICPINIVDEVVYKAASTADLRVAMGEAEAAMRARRQLKPGQDNNFTIETAEAFLDFWGRISRVLFLALPLLVGISLVVGGIVIMNIMLMAVTERTREIGIRKALGARRGDVLAQFVVEAATLSTVGAALGIALGIGLAFLVKAATPLPAAVAPWSLVLAVSLGLVVGVAAGSYPAYRAAKLDPIAALRAE